ncbi:MAG: hypothetical protein ACWIPI_08330 [Polaribacter sp.]
MKNVFFALAFMLISSFTFANNTKVDNDSRNSSTITINGITFSKLATKENIKIFTNDATKLPPCTAFCSVTIGFFRFRARGGNLLSSCKRAGRKCIEKLEAMVAPLLGRYEENFRDGVREPVGISWSPRYEITYTN